MTPEKILYRYRVNLEMSQIAMAKFLGVSRSRLAFWEVGMIPIPSDILDRVKIDFKRLLNDEYLPWTRLVDDTASLKPSGAMVYTVEKGANSLPVTEFQEALDALEGRRR